MQGFLFASQRWSRACYGEDFALPDLTRLSEYEIGEKLRCV